MTSATPSLDQKTIRTSPLLWILGLLFALFLGALGTRALSDAVDLFDEPLPETFTERLVGPLRDELAALERQPDPREAKIDGLRRDLAEFDRALARAEESWSSWLQTRATLGGSKQEDSEIRARRNRLDALRAERDEVQVRLSALLAEPDPRQQARADLQHRINAAEVRADKEFRSAHRIWRGKVLGARLALVLPVLLVAVLLWRRRTRISYVTLLWGYLAFTAWMVLWGIGPYLPHYGGYAQLGLGLVATAWGTITLARWLNSRAGLRRRRIVDQAIARHRCPSCSRDYLLGREVGLDAGLGRKARTLHYDANALHPHHCAGCGLALFAPCRSCHEAQLVHADRCANCGAEQLP
jgi:hypothetical protein